MKKALLLLCVLALSTKVHAQQFITDPYKMAPRSLIEEFGNILGAAPSASARRISVLALELIKDFEGWIPNAYNDPVGYCTIGYGHLIALQRCENIVLGEFSKALSEESGSRLLEQDTKWARLAVQNLVLVNLSDDQFGALSSFVFNVGQSNFKTSKMLRLLNAGETDLAAGQFGRWIKARGRILPGLVARRACEEALFKSQLSLSSKFDRSACRSLGAAPSAGPLIDIDVGEVQ
ncbi:glycoside hydrolase family protein [Sinorhizobium medicae]|nr:glycoside hydrolase family protein [Sinorhizobium medicae]